jgi:hypothetical protein
MMRGLTLVKWIVICVIAVVATSPALAKRDLPDGAMPQDVLSAFLSDLKAQHDNPDNADVGLNAMMSRVSGYWIRTSRQKVQETGQVPDLNSLLFFRFNRPVSWEFAETGIAGDFARIKVTFTPSAIFGVVRDGDYEPIKATYNLIHQAGEWYIVDFKGPKQKNKPELQAPLEIIATDTPQDLVSRVMDVLVSQSGEPRDASDIFGNLETGRALAKRVENLWADDRDGRKSMGQFVTIGGQLNPSEWMIADVTTTEDTATVAVSVQSGTADLLRILGYEGDNNVVVVRFSARRVDGIWVLVGFGP